MVPQIDIAIRQTSDQLCVLLGIPPEELDKKLGKGPIPGTPTEVIVGIPADLLRRRPDVRRSERQLAAQSEQIGIATAELYPTLVINGSIGVQSSRFSDLFRSESLFGNIGPAIRWDILNYGRLINRIRIEDARFQELAASYLNTVLRANQEVEDGLVMFLQSQEQTKKQAVAEKAARASVQVVKDQEREGKVDMNRVFVIERDLVQQQNLLAEAQGNIALGLIDVYRAIGGGWQIRCAPAPPPPAPQP
jgi:outer membrane protein TolC